MLFLFVLSFSLALLLTFIALRAGLAHAKAYPHDAPQRFHVNDSSRLGGVAIAAACAVAWGAALFLSNFALANASFPQFGLRMNSATLFGWLVTCAIALGAGLADDLTQRFGARMRLLVTLVGATAACWLLDVRIARFDLVLVDQVLAGTPWLAYLFAVVAIAGLPHAVNIIDGYNGLAGVVIVIILAALIYLSQLMGDRELMGFLVCVMGATIGFLYWNYPRGLVFAGDGGSYFWGTAIALGSISLVQRHPQISPWAIMLLLIYPVWETVFSAYRKLLRGKSPSMADSLHFHQLIYRRLVRGVFHNDVALQMLMRNNRTSPYLWAFTLLSVVPAVLFWNNTPVLIAFCILFAVSYVLIYLAIIRFKVPRWMRR